MRIVPINEAEAIFETLHNLDQTHDEGGTSRLQL